MVKDVKRGVQLDEGKRIRDHSTWTKKRGKEAGKENKGNFGISYEASWVGQNMSRVWIRRISGGTEETRSGLKSPLKPTAQIKKGGRIEGCEMRLGKVGEG